MAHCIRRLPPLPFSPGSNLRGDCFVFCFFLIRFFFNLLFFFICFFFSFTYLFFLINLKGLCHGFLFLHKSRSPRGPLITLRVNSFFFGISHSPRTPLGHAHRCSICKRYADKLQRFSRNCHIIFILTMPTALGRRSGAVYGEKSPKTRLVRIYCYSNTLYIVNLTYW